MRLAHICGRRSWRPLIASMRPLKGSTKCIAAAQQDRQHWALRTFETNKGKLKPTNGRSRGSRRCP